MTTTNCPDTSSAPASYGDLNTRMALTVLYREMAQDLYEKKSQTNACQAQIFSFHEKVREWYQLYTDGAQPQDLAPYAEGIHSIVDGLLTKHPHLNRGTLADLRLDSAKGILEAWGYLFTHPDFKIIAPYVAPYEAGPGPIGW